MGSKIIVFLAFIGTCVVANPDAVYLRNLEKAENQSCHQILQNNGSSASFDTVVAHAVHSMTLDVVKKFDPEATVDNFVPTIQLDLRSQQAIIPHALDLKPNNAGNFLTEGMKILDMVLSHMDEKHWDVVGFSTLEKVAHAFHMREVWAKVYQEFEKLGTEIPTPNEEFCQCAMDLENNGIMKNMRFIAMALREPGLVYGDQSFGNRNNNQSKKRLPIRPGYFVGYNYRFRRSDVLRKGENTEGQDLFLHKLSEAMPPLKDAAAWKVWKDASEMNQQHHKDVALFLYCAIAKAHARIN